MGGGQIEISSGFTLHRRELIDKGPSFEHVNCASLPNSDAGAVVRDRGFFDIRHSKGGDSCTEKILKTV